MGARPYHKVSSVAPILDTTISVKDMGYMVSDIIYLFTIVFNYNRFQENIFDSHPQPTQILKQNF